MQGDPEVIGQLLIEFSYMLLIDNYLIIFISETPNNEKLELWRTVIINVTQMNSMSLL
jgi:hypothetical protein